MAQLFIEHRLQCDTQFADPSFSHILYFKSYLVPCIITHSDRLKWLIKMDQSHAMLQKVQKKMVHGMDSHAMLQKVQKKMVHGMRNPALKILA